MQTSEWHKRFCEQAEWTRSMRRYLFSQIQIEPGARVLEVGCGTGAILAELTSNAVIHGMDINFEYLSLAQKSAPTARLACADAVWLPYADASFKAACCHFFLMWVDAAAALREMYRVTSFGGWLMALAEPDYGGRIDYPDELSEIGRLQKDSLSKQGAQPEMGRRLPGLFYEVGLHEIRFGIIGAESTGERTPTYPQSEWQVIESDLKDTVEEDRLAQLRKVDIDAMTKGERVLFVPTFFAMGRKT